MAQPIDQLIFPRWLLPVDGHSDVLEGYGVAVQEDKIVAVDQAKRLKAKYSAAEEFNLTDHALLPGFINAHTHAAMNLLKGFANDLPLMTWLEQHIWPAEAKWMSDDFVYQGTQLAIAEMLKSGTTCFNDMYYFEEVVADTVIEED